VNSSHETFNWPRTWEIRLGETPNLLATMPVPSAFALGAMGESARDAVPHLIRLLENEDPRGRSVARLALGEMGESGRDAVPQLIELLADEDPDVRTYAVLTMGEMGESAKDAVPKLIELLDDEDLRAGAASALGEMGESAKDAVPKLIELLDDEDLRAGAASALGEMGKSAKDAVPKLIELLDDEDPLVKNCAASALGKMGKSAQDAVPQLAELLMLEDYRSVRTAVEALGKMGAAAKHAAPQLVDLLRDERSIFRKEMTEVVREMGDAARGAGPGFVKMLGTADATVRTDAADFLMSTGPHNLNVVVGILDEALRHADRNAQWHVLAYAVAGNDQLGSGEPVGELIHHVGHLTPKNTPAIPANLDERIRLLDGLREMWDATSDEEHWQLRKNIAERVSVIGQAKGWTLAKADTLDQWRDVLQESGFVDQAASIADVQPPWWDRQPAFVRIVIYVAAFVGLYFALLLTLYCVAPIAIFWIHSAVVSRTPIFQLPFLGGGKLFLKSAVAFVGLTHLTKSARVRGAWIARYANDRTTLSDLDDTVFDDYTDHPDLLDAWVAKHLHKAKAAFSRMSSVKDRKIFIPLPVSTKTTGESRLLPEPSAADFQGLLSHSPSVLTILGEGGTGKSTLAINLARWASDDDSEKRLFEYAVIPVLLEEETGDLLAYATETLVRMVGPIEGDRLPKLVECLLENRRLMVIVDGLSERAHSTRQAIRSVHGHLPVNLLVVTSRTSIDFGPIETAIARPQKLDTDTLAYFLPEYLRQTEREAFFPGRQVFQLGDRLMALVEHSPQRQVLTPLLVKIFVENAASRRERDEPLDEMPLSVPDTILEYLRSVNPVATDVPSRVPHEKMIECARLLGRVCLGEEFVPRPFYREDAEGVLRDATGAKTESSLIDRLVDNGVLEQYERGGTQFLRFSVDLFAEYLAALSYLNELKANSDGWFRFIARVEQAPGYPESPRGFLVALEDVVATYGEDFRVPELQFPWTDD